MVSGTPLSDQEKDKIRNEIKYKTKRQLAKEMNLHPLTVRRFVQLEKLEE